MLACSHFHPARDPVKMIAIDFVVLSPELAELIVAWVQKDLIVGLPQNVDYPVSLRKLTQDGQFWLC